MPHFLLRSLWVSLIALCAAPATAQEWWEAETDNFVVKSQGSREEVREFALDLERFDATLRIFQGLPVGNRYAGRTQKLTVYRFGDHATIAALAGRERTAAFYVARAGASAAFLLADDSMEADTAFRHEYAHYFMTQNFPAHYPLWYAEGFASVMATARSNFDNSVHVGELEPLPKAASDLPLELFWSDSPSLAPGNYRAAALLTHYLMFDQPRLTRLKSYLVALGEGFPADEAARRNLGEPEALRAELLEHAGRAHQGMDIDLTGYPLPQAHIRRLDTTETGLLVDEIALRRGSTGDAADAVHARLSAPDAPEPDHPLRLELLGHTALARSQPQEAEGYGARLATAEPDRSAGFLLLSLSALAQVRDNPEMALHAGNLAWLAANRDRTDPRPLILYYRIALSSSELPDERAKVALEAAYDMASSDPAYRLLLTRHLLSLGRIEAARAALGPIMFGGHLSETSTFAPIVALVDTGDAEPAIAAIDALLAQDRH